MYWNYLALYSQVNKITLTSNFTLPNQQLKVTKSLEIEYKNPPSEFKSNSLISSNSLSINTNHMSSGETGSASSGSQSSSERRRGRRRRGGQTTTTQSSETISSRTRSRSRDTTIRQVQQEILAEVSSRESTSTLQATETSEQQQLQRIENLLINTELPIDIDLNSSISSSSTTNNTSSMSQTQTVTVEEEVETTGTTQSITTQSMGSSTSSSATGPQQITSSSSSIASTDTELTTSASNLIGLTEQSTLREFSERFNQVMQQEEDERGQQELEQLEQVEQVEEVEQEYYGTVSPPPIEEELPMDAELRRYLRMSKTELNNMSPTRRLQLQQHFQSYRSEKFQLLPDGRVVSNARRGSVPHNDPFLQASLRETFGEPAPGFEYIDPRWLTQAAYTNAVAGSLGQTRTLQQSEQQIMLEKRQLAEKAIAARKLEETIADKKRREEQNKLQSDRILAEAQEKLRRLAGTSSIQSNGTNTSTSTTTNSHLTSTTNGTQSTSSSSTIGGKSMIDQNRWVKLDRIDPAACGRKIYEYAQQYYREDHLFNVNPMGILSALNIVSRNICSITGEYNSFMERLDAENKAKQAKLDQLEHEKRKLYAQKLDLEENIINTEQSSEIDNSSSASRKYQEQLRQAELIKEGDTTTFRLPRNISRSASLASTLPGQYTFSSGEAGFDSRSAFTRTRTGLSSGHGPSGPNGPNGPNGPSGPGRGGRGSGRGPPRDPGRGNGFGPPEDPDPNRGINAPVEDFSRMNIRAPVAFAPNEFSIIKHISPKTISNSAKFEDSTKWISFKSAFLASAEQYNYADWLTKDSIEHWEELLAMYGGMIRPTSLYATVRQVHKQIFGLIKTSILKIYSTPEMLEGRTLQYGILHGYADTTEFNMNEKLEVGGAFSDNNCYLLWRVLTELYQKKLSMDLVKLIRDLYSFHWNTRQDISQQLAGFQQLLQRLNEACLGRTTLPGHLLPQSVEASFLLASLPPELNQVNISLGTKENLTIEQVFTTIQSVISNFRAKKAFAGQSQYAHFSSNNNNNNYKNNYNNKKVSFKNNGYKNNNYNNKFNSNSSSSNSNYNNNNKQSYSFVTDDNDENYEDTSYYNEDENVNDIEQNESDHENQQENEIKNELEYDLGSEEENDTNDNNYLLFTNDLTNSSKFNSNELKIDSDSDSELIELSLPITPTFSLPENENMELVYEFNSESENDPVMFGQISTGIPNGGAMSPLEYNNEMILPIDYYCQLTDTELESSIIEEINSSEPDGYELAEMIKVMNMRCKRLNIHLYEYGEYINYSTETLELPEYSKFNHSQLLSQIRYELQHSSPNYQHFYELVFEQIKRKQNDIELAIKESVENLKYKLDECKVHEISTQTEIEDTNDSISITSSDNQSVITNTDNNQLHLHIIELDEQKLQNNRRYRQSMYSLILHDDLALTTFDEMLSNPYTFVLDSGATRHVTGNKRILLDTREPKYDFTIKSIYGHFEKVKLIGSIKITPLIKINNVHYLPGAKYNLISVSKLNERAVEINFTTNGAYCKHGGSTFLVFRPVMGLFIYQNTKFNEKESPSIEYIHRRTDQIVPRPSNKNQPISSSRINSSSKPTITSRPNLIRNPTTSTSTTDQPRTSVIPSVPSTKPIHPPRRKIPKKKQFYQPANRPTTRSSNTSTSTASAAMSLLSHHRPTIDLTNSSDDEEEFFSNNDYALSAELACFATMFGDKVHRTKEQWENEKRSKFINEKHIKLLHLQLGHKKITPEILKALNLHTNIDLLKLRCSICSLVKLVNRPTGKGEYHHADRVNQRLGFDTVGPFRFTIDQVLKKLVSIHGNSYLFNIIDHYSRFAWCFPIQTKGQATEILIKLITRINYQNDENKVKSIHSDNAAEFISRELVQFCENLGINKTTTPAYSPSLNGLIERFNRTLVQIIKSMLLTSDLHQQFFDEAAKYSVFIYNNTPNAQIEYYTPQQVQLGYTTNLQMLHIFGSNAYYKLADPQAKAGKFELVSKIGVFVGYQYDQVFSYRILGENNKIITTRNAVINNGQFDHIVKLNYQSKTRSSILHEFKDEDMIDDEEELWIYDTIQPSDQPIQPSLTEQILEQKQQQEIQIETENQQIKELEQNIQQLESVESEMNIESNVDTQLEYEHDQVEDYPLFDISEESTPHTSPESIESVETTPESIEETVRSVTPTESIRENIIRELPQVDQQVSRYGRRRTTTTRYGGVNPLDLDPLSRFQAFGFALMPEQFPIKTQYGLNSINDIQINKLKDRVTIPYTLTQALSSTESLQWEKATKNEIESMIITNSFTLVDKPELITKKPIPTRLLYSIKYDINNDIDTFKCRLIALGYRQKAGIDYGDIYSPVCKLKSILVVLSLAVQHGFKVVMIDFTTAFMNADIDQETYINLPLDVAMKYFNVKSQKQNVFRLNKALYGLHQSPILWFTTIRNFLITILGYIQLRTDVCIFIKFTETGVIIITVYVDDTIAAYDEESEKIWLEDKKKIQDNFKIKDLGVIKSLLKLEIIQVNPNTIVINQKGYVERLTKEYNLEYTKSVNNPEIKNLIEESTSNLLTDTDITKYQSLVGSLNYIATKTRPDISFSVNQLSRQLVKPTESHWRAAIKVLCYLKTTASIGIVLQKQSDENRLYNLEIYTDAAHGNQADMKSTLGYLTFFNGNLISWNCVKAKVVSLSTMESELYAIMEAAMELIFFKKLTYELTKVTSKSIIYTDSTSANALIRADRFHQRAKHLKIKLYYLREELDKKVFDIIWIDTKKMLADINTKYLPTNQFQILRDQILYNTTTFIKSSSSSTTN